MLRFSDTIIWEVAMTLLVPPGDRIQTDLSHSSYKKIGVLQDPKTWTPLLAGQHL